MVKTNLVNAVAAVRPNGSRAHHNLANDYCTVVWYSTGRDRSGQSKKCSMIARFGPCKFTPKTPCFQSSPDKVTEIERSSDLASNL